MNDMVFDALQLCCRASLACLFVCPSVTDVLWLNGRLLEKLLKTNNEYTGWSNKNRTCLSVDNFATFSGRKACDISKVYECFKEKIHNLDSRLFKYFCL